MFKKSPQKGSAGRGVVATIPENESLREEEADGLLSSSSPDQHRQNSMDLIPVTDSISHALGRIDTQRLGGSPPSSEGGGGGSGGALGGVLGGVLGGASASASATTAASASTKGDASGAVMVHPTNDLSPKNSTLKMMRLWDVSMGPFKKTMVGGVLVPNALAPVQFLRWTKRRVTLELYGEADAVAASASSSGPPIAEIVTTTKTADAAAAPPTPSTKLAGADDKFALADSDVLYLRIYKQHQLRRRRIRMGGHAGSSDDDPNHDDDNLSVVDADDDASLISGMHHDSFLLSPFRNDSIGKEWKEHRSYKLEEIAVLHSGAPSLTHPGGGGRVLEVKMGFGAQTVTRDLRFDTADDAAGFEKLLNKLRDREKARAQRKIAQYKTNRQHKLEAAAAAKSADKGGGKGFLRFASPTAPTLDSSETGSQSAPGTGDATKSSEKAGVDGEEIRLLVEIVSATDLPVADISSTDAYVVVLMGGRERHKTRVVSKTLDPIWTLRTGSLCLISMTPEEFFSCSSGMTLLIKDYDAVGANDVLGQVVIGLDDLLESKGERVGYDVVLEKNFRQSLRDPLKTTKLYLRIKEASQDDVEFIREFQSDPKRLGVYAGETFLPIVPPSQKLLKRQVKRDHQTTMYRVKPFPDPNRVEETKWMSKDQLIAESLKPSTHWVEAGSGHVGKLYLEILGCEGLPNMDAFTANLREATDAFACVVFEDAIVNTAIIPDCLSPRWMPWCRRAFVFNITHPSSTLLIGLFDFDPEKSPLQLISRAAGDLHDAIGRIVIRLSNYRQGIDYTTAFPLYYGELPEQRVKMNGKIWIRFRTEWADVRKGLIAAAVPPTPTTVSVHRRVDFQVAHYTVEGPHDENAFDMGVFTRYIEELQSYEILLNYFREAAYTVWLWRGHFPVTVNGQKYLLPLHSFIAFVWGMIVTWNFNAIPSFICFSIGWAFVAVNGYLRSSPSPWHLVPPYHFMLGALILNKVPKLTAEITLKSSIRPNQGKEEQEAWEKAWEEKARRWKRDKELQTQHYEELLKEFGEEQEDEDISTSKDAGLLSNLTVNPLKPVLYPIQLQLKQVVGYIRIAKSIILWDETFTAFWITTACFAASFVLFWIPFGFLIRWSLRIVAFCVLGPWMAIVDRWYFKEKPGLTDAEKDAIVRRRLRSQVESAVLAAANFQIRKERTKKLKDMTKYLFGKFTLSVPRFCEDNFRDKPLPESYADPHHPDRSPPVVIAERVYGQRLSGDMIPKREVQVEALAARRSKAGKAAKDKNPLSKIRLVSQVVATATTGKHGKKESGGEVDQLGSPGRGAATPTKSLAAGMASMAEKLPLLGKRHKKSAYSSVAPGTETGES